MADLDRRISSYRSFPQVNYLITSWVEYKQGCVSLQVAPDPGLLQQKIRECWDTIKGHFLQTSVMEQHELMVFESFVVNETDILERAAAASRTTTSLPLAASSALPLCGTPSSAAATALQHQQQVAIPSAPLTPYRVSNSNPLGLNNRSSPMAPCFSPNTTQTPLLASAATFSTPLGAAAAATTTTYVPPPSVTPAASTGEASWSSGGPDEEATLQAAVQAGIQAAQLAQPDFPPADPFTYADYFAGGVLLNQNPVVVISSDDSLMSTLVDGDGGFAKPTAGSRNQIAAKANYSSRTSKYSLAGKNKNILDATTNKANRPKSGRSGYVWVEEFGLFQQDNKRDAYAAAATEFMTRFTCNFDPYARLLKFGPRDRQNFRCSCVAEQASADPILIRFQRRPENPGAGLAVFCKGHLAERTWNHFCETASSNRKMPAET